MLLNKDGIKRSVGIDFADEDNYRNASYDARIGAIISPDGQTTHTYILPPQGIVRVISKEIITMPDSVAGFALVKTSLCNEGILALNIGILDPTYKGPVSSALINFGNKPQVLAAGDVFLRLTFFRYVPPKNLKRQKPFDSRQEYVRENQKLVLQYFSSTFLDIDNTTERVATRVFDKYQKAFFVYVPMAAVVLALLTFLLNFSSLSLVQKFIQPADSAKVISVQQAIERQQRQAESLAEENRQLLKRIDNLEAKLGAKRTKTLPTSNLAR